MFNCKFHTFSHFSHGFFFSFFSSVSKHHIYEYLNHWNDSSISLSRSWKSLTIPAELIVDGGGGGGWISTSDHHKQIPIVILIHVQPFMRLQFLLLCKTLISDCRDFFRQAISRFWFRRNKVRKSQNVECVFQIGFSREIGSNCLKFPSLFTNLDHCRTSSISCEASNKHSPSSEIRFYHSLFRSHSYLWVFCWN